MTFSVLECFLTAYFLEIEIMSVPDYYTGSVGITLSNAQELTSSKPSAPKTLVCLSELHGAFLRYTTPTSSYLWDRMTLSDWILIFCHPLLTFLLYLTHLNSVVSNLPLV